MSKELFFIFIAAFNFIAMGSGKYIFEVQCNKSGGTQQLILSGSFDKNEPVEGCFFFSQYVPGIFGKLQPGGFTFLDPKVFDVAEGWGKLKEDWAKNDFPVDDISSLTNGMDINNVFSFSVSPIFQGDSATLFFKYAVFSLKDERPSEELDNNYNIKLYYKKLKVRLNEGFSPAFVNSIYDTCLFEFKIKNEQSVVQSLLIQEPDVFFSAIKKSIAESKISGNVEIKLTAEYLQADSLKKDFLPWADSRIRIKQNSLTRTRFLRDSRTNTITELSLPVYTAKLSFPFHLYNKEKQNLYDSYGNNQDIFQSELNIVIVPVSFRNDSLTADIFWDYSKIVIDSFQRWTPVKKRIKIKLNDGLLLDLPKENWTANFTRSGKKYNIYGYTDFDQFINEYIAVQFESIKANTEF